MLLVRALSPMAVSALAACLLAGTMATRAARQIVRPLNELDLTEPWREVEYDELAPLMARLRSQDRLIQRRLRLGGRRFRINLDSAPGTQFCFTGGLEIETEG